MWRWLTCINNICSHLDGISSWIVAYECVQGLEPSMILLPRPDHAPLSPLLSCLALLVVSHSSGSQKAEMPAERGNGRPDSKSPHSPLRPAFILFHISLASVQIN